MQINSVPLQLLFYPRLMHNVPIDHFVFSFVIHPNDWMETAHLELMSQSFSQTTLLNWTIGPN